MELYGTFHKTTVMSGFSFAQFTGIIRALQTYESVNIVTCKSSSLAPGIHSPTTVYSKFNDNLCQIMLGSHLF